MEYKTSKGFGIHFRRGIAYVVLVILTFLCLFWFYVLFINATRSNANLSKGFSALPGVSFFENWTNMVHGTLPIFNGMLNSFFVAACSAVLSTYFSTMTAYAIHAYDFKFKNAIFTFILMIMTIPGSNMMNLSGNSKLHLFRLNILKQKWIMKRSKLNTILRI